MSLTQKKSKFFPLVVSLIVGLVLIKLTVDVFWWHGFLGNAGNRTLFQVVRDLKRVRVGMTYSEVESIMGPPLSKFQRLDRNEELWIFAKPYVASEDPRCVFNVTEGRVVRIVEYE